MKSKSPASADVQVGMNIRQLRLRKNMSQQELAGHLSITFQQVQKYEKGSNRVSASRLVQIAAVFGVKVDVLFTGATAELDMPAGGLPQMSREALAVAVDFDAIENPAVRLTIRGLVKSLSNQLADHAA
ncbi:helix-turn-helix domain-containing protein [Rhizobium sp. YTUHZ045]|uniref:helix-turn-helix domain-containing protein n=1 Tax=Rhizobium sp. YTUHZ045 TaxID=2962888 RepID=UPI003DA9BACB